MSSTAKKAARGGELIQAFLIDLEHEHSRQHRQLLEAHYGLGRLGDPPDIEPGRDGIMMDESLAFARKWFGAGAATMEALKAVA